MYEYCCANLGAIYAKCLWLAKEKMKYSYFLVINIKYLGEVSICQATLQSSTVLKSNKRASSQLCSRPFGLSPSSVLTFKDTPSHPLFAA